MTDMISAVARGTGLPDRQVQAVMALLDDGATVPFIARYRKEASGGLDEVEIMRVRDEATRLKELNKRREAIVKSMEEAGTLTPDLRRLFQSARSLATLEDLYLPYRPKRKTRASTARERGLEPLATMLLKQQHLDPREAARPFVNADNGVESIDDALAGACDIIAEQINEDTKIRDALRDLFKNRGTIFSTVVKAKQEAAAKFRDYFDWKEPVSRVPSHRILAMLRGEAEGFLRLKIRPPEASALQLIERRFARGSGPGRKLLQETIVDGWKRLLAPSIESSVRADMKARADREAIAVFAANVRELLLAPPLGRKRVLAIDPGFRTGCKVVCLDEQGGLEHTDVIYPHPPQRKTDEAARTIRDLCERFRIEAIAVGNGTAGRESETFLNSLGLPSSIAIVMVNESGASIYSASGVAREELPDEDVTVRGAVSIGRRLADPLAELVKIDPKSIGVGQYQHDVNQTALQQALDDVVTSCVNAVGVQLNTASARLLQYVSGLGPQLAGAIVARRATEGPFASRSDLKKVPRLGAKAFEQAAGFLRIRDAKNPLDSSAVHPESYGIVTAMAKDVGCTVAELMSQEACRQQIDVKRYVTDRVGMPTLTDIVAELAKPGRDPRQEFEAFHFDDKVHAMEDLQPGMKLPGLVTNVTKFGAFVDIGVHQDGLVHISQLADRYVSDPNDVVKVQQKVMVKVLEVDIPRKRISLSMKEK